MVWSAMTLLTGFSKKYWHLVLTRFITGIGYVCGFLHLMKTTGLLNYETIFTCGTRCFSFIVSFFSKGVLCISLWSRCLTFVYIL